MRACLLPLLLLAACQVDDTEDTEDTWDAYDGPLPAVYADVAADHEAMRDAAMTDAPPWIDVLLSGDVSTFYEALTEDMKALVSLVELEDLHDQLTAGGEVGAPYDTRVMGVGRDMLYMAAHPWEGPVDLLDQEGVPSGSTSHSSETQASPGAQVKSASPS